MRVALLALVLIAAAALAGPLASPASAQDVGAAVADLRDHDVTYEEGAVDDRDLAELDAIAVALDDGTDVKIVVLADPVGDEFSSTRDFAEQVLDGLGGERRVIVFDPGDVGIASSVDPPTEVEPAERAAIDAANSSELVRRRRAGRRGGAGGDEANAGPDAGRGRRAATASPGARAAASSSSSRIVVLVVVWLLRRSSRRAEDAADRAGVAGRGGEGARGDRPHLAPRARPRRPA